MLTVDDNIPLLFNTVCKKKFMSNRLGLVHFAIAQVISVVNLPDVKYSGGIQITYFKTNGLNS